MRFDIERKVNEEIESDNISLKGVAVGDRGYNLDISNVNNSFCYRSLLLNFSGEYKITMDQAGMVIERLVKMPSEKGGDYYETLQKIENGKCYWEKSSSQRRGYKPLKIPFGARKDD